VTQENWNDKLDRLLGIKKPQDKPAQIVNAGDSNVLPSGEQERNENGN